MTRSKTGVTDQEENSAVSFVSRWSRLKHETKKNTENTAIEKIAAENKLMETDALEEQQKSSAKILTDEDMPDLEMMTADSDYTGFLSPGVSDKLRKLALRKLFHSDVFNIRDGLDEYDGDYTQFEKLGDIVTADMHHQIELEAQRKAKQLLDENTMNDNNVDNNKNALVDEIRVAEVNPEVTEIQLDESQTMSAAESAVEAVVNKNPEKPMKNNLYNTSVYKTSMYKTDDNTELEVTVTKSKMKTTSQNDD